MRFLIFIFTIFSSITFANFDGTWVGNGHFLLNEKNGDCPWVEVRFYHVDDKFVFRGGGYECASIKAEYPYSVFTISNGLLFQGNKRVGRISNLGFILESKEHGYTLKITKVSDHEIDLKETWQDESDLFIVNGRLKNRHL